MSVKITHAMIMAAGLGVRMRPLTLKMPKPLVSVGGQPLIAYAFDRLRDVGVKTAVVNVHYLPEQIEAWCAQQPSPDILISDERDAVLETGGGIVRALPLLGDQPFYVLNSDSFWLDGQVPALQRLAAAWNDKDMDCLLLLCDPARTTGYDGQGDFVLEPDGRSRRGKQAGALAFIGGYIVHPRLFTGVAESKFSMNVLWDRAIATGRLFGLAHDGHWLHVGTIEAIAGAEARLKQ